MIGGSATVYGPPAFAAHRESAASPDTRQG